MTREQAAAFLDSLTEDALQRLIVELTYYACTKKARQEVGGAALLQDLRAIMDNAAREHCLDALTGEPATDELPRGVRS